MGKGHKAKAPILQALGNDGQQRTLAKTGSNLHLSLHIQTKAPNRNKVRGFVVSGCSLMPASE